MILGLILMVAVPFVIMLILRFFRNHWPFGILLSCIGTFIGVWLFTEVWWVGLICACYLYGTFNPGERTFYINYDSDGEFDVEEKWGQEYVAIAMILLIITITKAITA